MSRVKVRLKSMLNRALIIMRGRGQDPVTVGPRKAFEVDADDLEGSHFRSLLKKNYIREVRRRILEEKPLPAPEPSLISARSSVKKKKKWNDAEEKPPAASDTLNEDPVSPDTEKDGK